MSSVSPRLKPGNRILIVEDEAGMRLLLVAVLASCGYEVAATVDGLDGIEWLRRNENKVDLVILDLHLQHLHGFEVLKRMRRHHPHLSVLLCSGHGDELAQAFSRPELDIFGTLLKPFEPAMLVSAVRRAMAGKGTDLFVETSVTDIPVSAG